MRAYFLLFFFAPHFIAAQISVTGVIQDAGSGENLPYANVSVKGSVRGTSTNLDGHFTLLDIPTDTSTLVVTYIGYAIKEVKLSPALLTEKISIRLEPTSVALQELIITDNAIQFINTASGVSHVTLATKQLSLLPSMGEVDIFRSLQLLPGVSGTNENSSGLYVRGGTPDQNLVLLDGMTVYKVDHFFGFFSAFNANAIKDVQLYKGGFPAKYGGRISSVVDLTGKTGNFEEVKGEVGINLISANGYVEIPVTPKLSFLFAGRRSYTDIIQSGVYKEISGNLMGGDPFPNVPNSANINVVEPVFYFYDWNSKLSFKPNDKDIFSISLYQGEDFLDESRVFTLPIVRPTLNPIEVKGNILEETNWGNQGISGKWSRQWSPKVYTNLVFAASEYKSKYNRRAALDITIPAEDSVILSARQYTFEDNKVQDFSARIDSEWLISATHKIEVGLSFTQSDINYKNIRNDTLLIFGRKQSTNYSSVYVSDTWQPAPKLTVVGGVRATYYELTNDYFYAPRLSATYNITKKIKVKGAVGEYFQFVNQITNENITEGSRDFWMLADRDLVDVSSSTHFIGGASYETNNWLFDVEGYRKDLQGLSEFSLRFRRGPEIDVEQLFFNGSGVAKGIDFLLQKKQGDYTGWMAYTYGQVLYNFPELNDGNSFYALHDQRHEFKMVHSYQIYQWNFSATFVYGSGKPYSEPEGKYTVSLLDGKDANFISIGAKNGSRLPEYHRLDISVHHFVPLGKKLKGDFGLSIFNVYNRKNIWYLEYDFSQEPVLVTEVIYLGMTPNLSFSVKF
ncbi:MAG: TonB-dependent receptor [Cyclobacteriaceae bacterium]|nr:TonB-dependent receptor [Cyclobacteriaceae bacterium]